MLRLELFKLLRQRTTWISAALLGLVLAFQTGTEVQFGAGGAGTHTLHDALAQLGVRAVIFRIVPYDLANVRGLVGVFITILAVRAITLEYQHGTIRVLLARGVGRLRLLSAKLLAVTILGLAALGAALALTLLITLGLIALAEGSLALLSALPGRFYADALIYIGTAVISMLATLLFAAALAVIGRNQAFALVVGIAYWLVEPIAALILGGLGNAIHSALILNAQAYLLGINLSNMPNLLISTQTLGQAVFPDPDFPALARYDGTHTLLVTLVYCLVFAAIAIFLTWRRDVAE
jgi:ABC-type transport system involved in multi-copper enzyme maturation permease subunit